MSWTQRRRVRAGLGLAGVAAVTLVAGCGGLEASGPAAAGGGLADAISLEGQSYAVGGKDFDEQLILCQIGVAALESVQATVTDRCNTGGTQVARDALLSGGLDMYFEYSGTAWITFLDETEPVADEQEQYEVVRERDLAENQIQWVGRSPFNNTYAFAVVEARAEELGLTTLSDMAAYINSGQPGSTCIDTEYSSRDDGLPGLQQTYGFQVVPEILQTGVIYQATADGDCLFGLVFTTDGRIPELGLRVLEDDLRFHPNYNVSATIRSDAYDRNPAIAQVFEPIIAALDDKTMARLNLQVSGDEALAPRDVARTWLAEEGFIGGA